MNTNRNFCIKMDIKKSNLKFFFALFSEEKLTTPYLNLYE